MHRTKLKEDINISYISAICASAGIDYDIQRHDDDSTDGIIKKRIDLGGDRFYLAQLRIQLKCTSSRSQYEERNEIIKYKLRAKNYNDLCTPSTTPIILGLLVLPEDESSWVTWSTEELLIKGCMYWIDLSGKQKTDNESSVNVQISKRNVINQDSLLEMLQRIAKGEWQ